MKQPQTYIYIGGSLGLVGGTHTNKDWEFVRSSDYALLKAEVERLKEENEQMESHYEDDTQTIADLRKELADAQENNHILNETIKRIIKKGKQP